VKFLLIALQVFTPILAIQGEGQDKAAGQDRSCLTKEEVMTKQIASLIGLALLVAVSASAQVTHKVEVNVPFPFVAAGKTWAAGTYQMDIRPDSGLATLHSPESGSRTFLTQSSENGNSTNNTSILFQRYGREWVLRAIVLGGIRADALPSKFERELISRKPSDSRSLLARIER